jgi:hypothetical protein
MTPSYTDCNSSQLAIALEKKIEGCKRVHEQSVDIDTAIIKRLKSVDNEKEMLVEELAIYRSLTAIDNQFEADMEDIREERARLNQRETDLRTTRDNEKRELKEVLPFSERC